MRFRLAAAMLLVMSGAASAGEYGWGMDNFGGGRTWGTPTYHMPAWRDCLKRRLDPWAFDPCFDHSRWERERYQDSVGFHGGESGYIGPDRSIRSVRGW